jgi:hypothetical protein
MGFMDMLKRNGLINDGSAPDEAEEQESAGEGESQKPVFKSSSRSSARPATRVAAAPKSAATAAQVDPEYVKSLNNALEKSRVRGFSEFLTQLGVFMKIPGMTEQLRFQAAVAQLETDGISRADITSSIEDRLTLLEGARAEFAQTVESRRQTVIGAKSAEKEAKQKQIEQKEREIQKLHQELQGIDVQVEEEESKLSNASASFEAAYGVVESDIRDLLLKVNTHLG